MRFQLLASIVLSATAVQAGVSGIPFPDGERELRIDLAGFSAKIEENRPDLLSSKTYFQHEDGRKHVTVVMKPSHGESATAIRDDRWAQLVKNGWVGEPVRAWDQGDRAFLSYFTEFSVGGESTHQKHSYTFLTHRDTRIEVHASLTGFTEAADLWFAALRESLRVVAVKNTRSPARTGARTERYPLGIPGLSFGSIELDVPDGWTAVLQDVDSPSGAAIRLSPPGDKPFLLLVTPRPLFRPEGPAGRCEQLRPVVEDIRQKFLEVAEEPELSLQELRGSHACGFYVSVTDRTVVKPSLEDFKYGTQGHATHRHAMLTFTILTNLKAPPELQVALAIIGSARHAGLPDSAETAAAAARMNFPGKTWGLAVDLDGFEITDSGPPAEGRGMHLVAESVDPLMQLSIFLESDDRSDTAKGYRRWYRDNHLRPIGGAKPIDVEESERNGLPILEYSYRIDALEGTLRGMNAFLVHDGVWIDVHMSLVPYDPADRAGFNRVLDSLRIVP